MNIYSLDYKVLFDMCYAIRQTVIFTYTYRHSSDWCWRKDLYRHLKEKGISLELLSTVCLYF